MKSSEATALIFIAGAVAFLLFFTKTGQKAVTYVTQGTPLQISFGDSDYVPGDYQFDYTPPIINGISTVPGITNNPSADNDDCCGCGGGNRSYSIQAPIAAQPTVYRSPDIAVAQPKLFAPSYTPPMVPDWAAYLRNNRDVAEHANFALKQPHWTKGAGLREADFNRDGVVSLLEYGQWHGEGQGAIEGRPIPKKPLH